MSHASENFSRRNTVICLAFVVSASLGFGLCGAAAFGGLPWLTPTVSAVLTTGIVAVPLLFYWIAGSNFGVSGLFADSDAQDMFYFIGFFLTLTGLFFSALQIAGDPAPASLSKIFIQNIVALLSTLVGLFLRNVLAYAFRRTDPSSDTARSREALQVSAAEFRQLTEDISAHMSTFSAGLARSAGEMRRAFDALKQAGADTKDFDSNLQTLKKSALGTCAAYQDIGASIIATNAKLKNDLDAVAAGSRTLVAATDGANQHLRAAEGQLRQSAKAVERLIAENRRLEQRLSIWNWLRRQFGSST